MLKGIDPLLTADLLWVLDAMGHGDDLAVVDANHPAERIARATGSTISRFASEKVNIALETEPSTFVVVQRREIGR